MTASIGQTNGEMHPEYVDMDMSVVQRAQMALTLASLFCEGRGAPLTQENGKPSVQVAAIAAALLS